MAAMALPILALAVLACPVPQGGPSVPHETRGVVHVSLQDLGLYLVAENAQERRFEGLRRQLRAAAPGADVQWWPETGLLGSDEHRRVVFVQSGEGQIELRPDDVSSAYAVGDVLLLEPGQVIDLEPAADLLAFAVPQPFPEGLPWIVRPDWDARITDTPGGCATDDAAYRRILLTWLPEKGPYVYHGLNAHRVRITDSFTHYHPVEGGFDELYLIQEAAPGAHLWIGEDLEPFLRPDEVLLGDSSGLLRKVPVAAGDLVYVPRGVVHRGVGDLTAQVIALPGFVPGTEVAVDDAIQRIDEQLGLDHPLAMPWHGGPPYVEVAPIPSSRFEYGHVEVRVDGAPFTTAILGDDPYLHPVLGPGGLRMTRAYPFEEREGEARDHPHHRSLWFTHGDVDGLDFWAGGDTTVRPTGLGDHASGVGRGFLETTDDWRAPDGRLMCKDRRRYEFFAGEGLRGIDVDVTLIAADGGTRLGDTKEGSMALRLAPGLTVDGSEGRARLVNSEGQEGTDAWGQRARWVLATGEVEGRPAAVVMMDHPQNLRHPTTWHARTYGLLAANPFGLSYFEGAPKGTGDVVLEPGGTLRLRYRLVFLGEVPTPERIEELFSDFAAR
jgi:quercetin dioxygenase-like cupin family protein